MSEIQSNSKDKPELLKPMLKSQSFFENQNQSQILFDVLNAILLKDKDIEGKIEKISNFTLRMQLSRINMELIKKNSKNKNIIDELQAQNTKINFLTNILKKMVDPSILNPFRLNQVGSLTKADLTIIRKAIKMTNQSKIYTKILNQNKINMAEVKRVVSTDSADMIEKFYIRQIQLTKTDNLLTSNHFSLQNSIDQKQTSLSVNNSNLLSRQKKEERQLEQSISSLKDTSQLAKHLSDKQFLSSSDNCFVLQSTQKSQLLRRQFSEKEQFPLEESYQDENYQIISQSTQSYD